MEFFSVLRTSLIRNPVREPIVLRRTGDVVVDKSKGTRVGDIVKWYAKRRYRKR